jgi:pimeloyl-ACP methyl ester carboxylesterase
MPHAVAPDGTRIHYDVTHGKGTDARTVVLVQGLGLSSRFWFEQPELLREAADGPRRIVVLDNRGTGKSDKPRGAYTMRRMADDVVAVLDAIDCDRAVIVGISMGGMIAQRVAMHHPKRVAGLVLLATLPGLPHSALPSPRVIAMLLSLPLQKKGRMSPTQNRLLLPEKELERAHVHFAKWPAALREDPISGSTFASQFAAVATNWTGKLHERIDCPTVVVSGAEDILIPPENGKRIADRIRNSKHVVLPGIAHAIPLLDRQVVARSLRSLAAMSPS